MELWNAAISIITSFSVVVSVLLLRRQLKLMEKSNYSTTFAFVTNHLQEPAIVNARKLLLEELYDKNIPLNDWRKDHIEAAKRICSTYDVVGIAIRNSMIPVEIIADSWGDSIRKTWTVVKPFIESLRKNRNCMEYWDDIEWLAEQALKFHKPYNKPFDTKDYFIEKGKKI